jgi:hypothetical protein
MHQWAACDACMHCIACIHCAGHCFQRSTTSTANNTATTHQALPSPQAAHCAEPGPLLRSPECLQLDGVCLHRPCMTNHLSLLTVLCPVPAPVPCRSSMSGCSWTASPTMSWVTLMCWPTCHPTPPQLLLGPLVSSFLYFLSMSSPARLGYPGLAHWVVCGLFCTVLPACHAVCSSVFLLAWPMLSGQAFKLFPPAMSPFCLSIHHVHPSARPCHLPTRAPAHLICVSTPPAHMTACPCDGLSAPPPPPALQSL